MNQQVCHVSVSRLLDLTHVTCQLQPKIHYTSDLHAYAPDFGWLPTHIEHTQCVVLHLVLDVVDLVLVLQLLPEHSTPSLLLGVCQASVVQGLPQQIAQHIGCNPQTHYV